MKKNILAENMKRFATKNLSEQSAPKDVIEKIEGSAPYYKVYARDGSEMVTIDFEDYEVIDKVDYGVDMNVTGTDNKGQDWAVGAQATPAGGGDWDWEFQWETLEKTSDSSSSGKMKKDELGSLKYSVSLRTEYGTLNDIEVFADDEDEAFDKAMKKAEDAIWTSKLDQIEIIR